MPEACICHKAAWSSSKIMKQRHCLESVLWTNTLRVYLGDSRGKSWSSVCNAQFCSELPRVCYWWHHQEIAYTYWICPGNANKVSQWLEPTQNKCLIPCRIMVPELCPDMLVLTSYGKVPLEQLVVTQLVKESQHCIEPVWPLRVITSVSHWTPFWAILFWST
jgi:hypothetical protein